MDVLLANPRGFCAGVDRAIEIVKRAIESLGAPIYVRHEVVHNRFVVDDLRQRGAVFVEELDEVPAGATVIFSAHGVSQAVRAEADRRGLKVFDATCPLVTKVHIEVARHCRAGRDVVLIGHAGHPEVEGTMGQWRREHGHNHIHLVEDVAGVATLQPTQPDNLAYTTQTTLSVDDTREIIAALQARFPAIDPSWVAGATRIGVTAGASAPEVLVEGVIDRLRALGAASVRALDGEPENVVFALPKELRIALVQ